EPASCGCCRGIAHLSPLQGRDPRERGGLSRLSWPPAVRGAGWAGRRALNAVAGGSHAAARAGRGASGIHDAVVDPRRTRRRAIAACGRRGRAACEPAAALQADGGSRRGRLGRSM
ncbi:MAG: hypothetical protein AVDCRST_MAG71-1512, partial [uncultured Lysobacter sp.]